MALQRHATSKLRIRRKTLMRIANISDSAVRRCRRSPRSRAFESSLPSSRGAGARPRAPGRGRPASSTSARRADPRARASRSRTSSPRYRRAEIPEAYDRNRVGAHRGLAVAPAAMVRPEMHFEIQRDDRKATIWPACPRAARSDRRAAGVRAGRGCAARGRARDAGMPRPSTPSSRRPERTRPNGQALYLFVNRSPGSGPSACATRWSTSYRDLLPRGRFPIAVIFLEIAPDHGWT